MQSGASVTPFPLRSPSATSRQCRHSLYLDQLAECLYETAALCDRFEARLMPEWSTLPQTERTRYREIAARALAQIGVQS
jgi:hypothetical protein